MKAKLFILAGLLLAGATLRADDAKQLLGKWVTKKTNDNGENYSQTVEITPGKFIFQILGADGAVFIHAEGEMKLADLGPFKTARFFNIKAGQTASDLEAMDDEFVNAYVLDYDTWMMTSNFDKHRDQKAGLDTYTRQKPAATGRTLVIDSIEMAKTPQVATYFVCFDASVGNIKKRFNVAGKSFSESPAIVPAALELPNVAAGQKCTFRLQLDDVEEDVCTDEIDNKCEGEFTASDSGTKEFRPESNWRFTVKWHLK